MNERDQAKDLLESWGLGDVTKADFEEKKKDEGKKKVKEKNDDDDAYALAP